MPAVKKIYLDQRDFKLYVEYDNGTTAVRDLSAPSSGGGVVVIDDLVTNDSFSALSAAQGVVLKTALASKQPLTGIPSAFTSRALSSSDNGANLICASAQNVTVNTGLPSGFGASFKGTVSFTGTATINDVRTTGSSNPWCALLQTGTDTYDVVGSKA